MQKKRAAERFRAFPQSNRSEYESLLKEFVEIPSVSVSPAHKGDMMRCAELAVATLEASGAKAGLLSTDGNPIVQGYFHAGKDLPTVTIYNHLDVQPASKESEPWDSEPFVFTKQGDRYLGRGTTDDKGPALAALFGARAAREENVPINIRVLWELEEEIGSPSFEKGLRKAATRVPTDSVIVSDTIWISRSRPACPAGLRGFAAFILRLETGTTDQHSGTTGGAARNPLGELMKVVSALYDADTGRVKVKGFYNDVEKPSQKELKDFLRSGFSVSGFKKDHQFKSIRSDDPLDVMKRIWAQPTMEVHGVQGGYSGPGLKTIIPARAEIKLSCRLVPNQDPVAIRKLIRDFVKTLNPDVQVVGSETMYPYKAPTTGALADAVRSSMKYAFGRDPVFVREGGSIGAIVSMEKILKCPVMFLGLSLPEHGYHAPNENFDWQQASGGMVAFARYFELLSEMPRAKRS